MFSKHDLMRGFGTLAHRSGIDRLATRRFGGLGSIFMLHSIVADDDGLPRENVHTTAGFLERILAGYVRARVPVVTLSEAMRRLQAGTDERFVCFTFDDGYRDNFTRALPIFAKYDAPLTVYVTSAFIERLPIEYWWGSIRHLVRDNEAIGGDELAEPLSMRSPVEKVAAYRYLSRAISSGELKGERLDALLARHHVTTPEALDRDAISPAELKQAADAHPNLEIGGHTRSHARLSNQPEDGAFEDIRRNKADLEALLGREVRHFAYPYGDRASCSDREFALAERAGYATATTTRVGNLLPRHLENRFALPRLRFIGPCESVGFIESQRSGLVTGLSTRFGDPVVTN